MKTFRFYAERIIKAKNLEEAEEIFTKNSFDFASEIEIEEIVVKPIKKDRYWI